MTSIRTLKDKESFDNFVKENSFAVVHFSASWSPVCGQLNETLADVSKEYPNAFVVATVDAEGVPKASQENEVTVAPTIILFKNGKRVDRLDGFHPTKLRSLLVKHYFDGNNPEAAQTSSVTDSVKTEETLDARLKKLINKSRLTLFMKGSPEQPKCGFSRQIIQLLRDVNAEFWTFDILSDDEVRQGLKVYSDWPTYPQLYLDGELLGGLDVIREELKDPSFVEKLPKLC